MPEAAGPAAARALLALALPEFRDMGMTPWLDRALRLQLRLQGSDGADPARSLDVVTASVQARRPDLRDAIGLDGTVTLLFSDMENFTLMTERLGDTGAWRLIQEHHRIVRAALADAGGRELELQGDGFLLAFGSAEAGLRCAVDIQRRFAAWNAAHPEHTMRVRIGIHAGEALRDHDSFFGRTVILAARIAAQAAGGEVVMSEAVHLAAAENIGRRRSLGFVSLKGIAQPQQLWCMEGAEMLAKDSAGL